MAWKKDYYNPPEQTEDATSKINAAGLIISTLEKLWSECYTSMAQGNYGLWNTKLDAIWVILGGDEITGGNIDNAINEIDIKLYETGSLKGKTGVGFQMTKNPNSALQYQMLKRKSLFLRRLQNKQGKGTAYKTDDEDDFD